MKKNLLLISAILALCSCQRTTEQLMADQSDYTATEISEGWKFKQQNKEEWYPATVPGVVHTDLYANKLIPDPYYSTNETDLQWIENEEWIYETTFTPTKEQFAAQEVFLDFKGLDTYADVMLNDKLILSSDNMFIEWRVPVKSDLKEGENSLKILFKSAYKIGCELAKAYPKLPADNDKGVDYKTCVFTRKAQYHFGWDWGPRFVTAGIWKPIYLESFNSAAIDNIHYVQLSQSEQEATFNAQVTLNGAKEGPATIILSNEAGTEYAKSDIELTKGIQTVSVPFKIANPELWWPNGMGKGKPKLYPITAMVLVDGKKAAESSARLGVRTIELIREPDSVGESFYFKVNGEPLFIKGANMIPQDVFLPNITPERQQKMVDIAVEANMNMLRVWGGGIYEDDDFYNACDENGIMVWQDFPFACAFYPWDDKFYASVTEEATQNVRRLRNHPSLAIWCGNNEIDEAWHKWGYKEDSKNYPWTDQEKKDIRKGIDDLFFDTVIPNVLAAEDTTRPYHPSSPVYGWGDPRSQVSGDVHYWGVFHGEEPFSTYKDKPGRFSNEYGHQSFANYQTWQKALKPEELVYLSEAFKIHQKNPKGYRVIEDYMTREVPSVQSDIRTYIYLSQLVQADGIRIAMEGHRQNRPFTMGTLYWQINDCWPVTSWSSMDYPYGYKALQYFAINSFAPTILSFDKEDKTDRVELWGVTDELEEKKGSYTLTLMTFTGDTLWSEKAEALIPANKSVRLIDRPTAEVLKGANPKDVVLVAEGTFGDKDMRTLFYFLPYKELNLPAADYQVTYNKVGKKVEATIKSNNLVKAVLFESDAMQLNPSNAYFDLLPGEEQTIILNFEEDVPTEKQKIWVTNLNDVMLKAKAAK